MSKSKQQTAEMYRLIDENRDTTREFDSKEQAQEKRNDMIQLGAKPEDLEIEPVDESPEPKTDGNGHDPDTVDAEVIDHAPEPDPAPEPTDGVAEMPAESTDLPDRELTDDPIEWLQQGSGELTTQIKGTTVITKKGFRVLQHHYDISTGSEIVVNPAQNGHEFCLVKAWAEMPDGRRAEAHASAHVDRGDDHYLLTSMADTRAKSRALSDVTGVGAVAIEEMSGVQTNDRE